MERVMHLSYEIEHNLIWVRCRDYATLSQRNSFSRNYARFASSFVVIDGVVYQRACVIKMVTPEGSFLCMIPDYVSWYRPITEGRSIAMGASFSPKFSSSFGMRELPYFALTNVNLSRLSESGVRLHRGWYPFESEGCLLHIAGLKLNDDRLHSYSVVVSSQEKDLDAKYFARDSIAANKLLLRFLGSEDKVNIVNDRAHDTAQSRRDLVEGTTPSTEPRAMYIIQRKY